MDPQMTLIFILVSFIFGLVMGVSLARP